MLYALSIGFPREAQGRKTNFMIRGRVVTFDNIKHYFRRKGVHDLRTLISAADAAVPTTNIDYWTSEPLPSTDNNDVMSPTVVQSQNLGHDDINPSVLPISDPYQIDHMMPLTTILSQLDQLLHLGPNFLDAVSIPDRNKRYRYNRRSKLFNFHVHITKGVKNLWTNCVLEAFNCFNRTFELIRPILDEEGVLFFLCLYGLVIPSKDIQLQGVFDSLFNFVSKLIEACYPHLRAVHIFISIFRSIPLKDRAEIAERARKSVTAHIEVSKSLSAIFKKFSQESDIFSSLISSMAGNLE